jgi:hypothetical protein
MPTINMKARWFITQLLCSVMALLLLNLGPSRILAQDGHSHSAKEQQRERTADEQKEAGALVKIVRESTERFKDVAVAKAEGYALQFGCVSGSDSGAMGLHYVNADLVNKGVLDATRPQIVIYEPNATHSRPPQLMGQLFHLFESPNRFGLPAFYTLHVWAWKENPNGAFVNWHPNVTCDSFAGEKP